MRSKSSRLGVVVLVAMASLATSVDLSPANAAHGALPSDAVAVAAGPGSRGLFSGIVGASAGGVVLRSPDSGLLSLLTPGGVATPIAASPCDQPWGSAFVSGTTLVRECSTGDSAVVSALDGSASTTVATGVAPVPVDGPSRLLAAVPNGAVFQVADGTFFQFYYQDKVVIVTAGGGARTLATGLVFPGAVATDANGIVVASRNPSSGLAPQLTYFPLPSGPSVAIQMPSGLDYNWRLSAVALRGSTIAYALEASDGRRELRQTTTQGALGTLVSNDPVVASTGAISLTATNLGWVSDTSVFRTRPVGGGALSTYTGPLAVRESLLDTDGSAFLLNLGSGATDFGTYRVADASGSPQLLIPAVLDHLRTWSSVALAPGRVAWVDDALPTPMTLHQRSVARSLGGALSAGTVTAVGADPAIFSAAVCMSCVRVFAAGPRTVVDDAAGTVRVYDNGAETQTFTGGEHVVGLSGVRLLTSSSAWFQTTYHLHDLAAGTSSDLPDAAAYNLWGNFLAVGGLDGSVAVRDLAKAASADRIVRPADPAVSINYVKIAGDTVAWGESTDSASSSWYRDYVHQGQAHAFYSEYITDVSPGYVVYRSFYDYVAHFRSIATGNDAATTIASDVWIDDETVAWQQVNGHDGSGEDGSGDVYIGSLPAFVDLPRMLGGAAAPSTLTLGTDWTSEFPLSKALSSCALTIRSGATTVRSIDCRAAASMGSARVVWDGTDNAGVPVAPGAYTWTLTGSDGDGALRDYDGTARAISGSIAVTAGATTPYRSQYAASEFGAMQTGASKIGLTPEEYQRTSVGVIAYIFGIAGISSPNPIAPSTLTGGGEVTTRWTASELPALNSVATVFAQNRPQAQKTASLIVAFLLSLSG